MNKYKFVSIDRKYAYLADSQEPLIKMRLADIIELPKPVELAPAFGRLNKTGVLRILKEEVKLLLGIDTGETGTSTFGPMYAQHFSGGVYLSETLKPLTGKRQVIDLGLSGLPLLLEGVCTQCDGYLRAPYHACMALIEVNAAIVARILNARFYYRGHEVVPYVQFIKGLRHNKVPAILLALADPYQFAEWYKTGGKKGSAAYLSFFRKLENVKLSQNTDY